MPRGTRLALLLTAWLPLACGGPGAVDAGLALSTAAMERAGAHCPLGGQKVLSGLDANADGVLQPGEVRDVAYVCNGQAGVTCSTIEGSVVVRNALDWTHLVEAGCTRISGTLEIAADGAATLGAPSPLQRVGALLVAGNDRLERLEFPALTAVDDGLTLRESPALASLTLPALASVGAGGITIHGELPLQALELPALTTLAGPLVLEGTLVSSLAAPALTAAPQGLSFGNNPWLSTVDLRALASAFALEVSDDPWLTALEAPALTSVAVLRVTRNPGLASIVLPALAEATGSIALAELGALRELDLRALAAAGDLTMDTPATLAVLDLSALREGAYLDLTAAGSEIRLPALGWARAIRLGGTMRLRLVDLTALAWIDQDLVVTAPPGISAGPTALALPALAQVGGAFRVEGLAGLTSLAAPALRSVGTAFSVADDPALPLCQAEAIAAGLIPPLPGVIVLSNLDAAATCLE